MTIANPGALPTVVANSTAIKAEQMNAVKARVLNNYATSTDRDADITSPVAGMACMIAGLPYYYDGNLPGWRGLPAGYIGSTVGPASQTDYSTVATVITLTATLVTGRRYRVWAHGIGTQITNTGTPTLIIKQAGTDVVRLPPLSNTLSLTASSVSGFTGQGVVVGTGSIAFTVTAASSASAFRIAANAVQLTLEDIGT